MIERHWIGVSKEHEAGGYIQHLRTETIPLISTIEGFIQANILKRTVEGGVEFLVITSWETLDAIKKFAGDEIDRAVVPTTVKNIMVRYDEFMRHYEVDKP